MVPDVWYHIYYHNWITYVTKYATDLGGSRPTYLEVWGPDVPTGNEDKLVFCHCWYLLRTWGGVFKCFAKNTKKVDREKICGIKTISHFTSDLAKVEIGA